MEQKIGTDQRRYYLLEQLRSIKSELGIDKGDIDKEKAAARFKARFAPRADAAPPEVRLPSPDLGGRLCCGICTLPRLPFLWRSERAR